jgi:hypothetical protein
VRGCGLDNFDFSLDLVKPAVPSLAEKNSLFWYNTKPSKLKFYLAIGLKRCIPSASDYSCQVVIRKITAIAHATH